MVNYCLLAISIFSREHPVTLKKVSFQLPYFYTSERHFIAMILQ
jgi:hypothetical protein